MSVWSFVERWRLQRNSIACCTATCIAIRGDPRILAIEKSHPVGKLKSARQKRAAECAGTFDGCMQIRVDDAAEQLNFSIDLLQVQVLRRSKTELAGVKMMRRD